MTDAVLFELHPSGDIALAGSPRERELVKRIPGGRYDKDTGLWMFPLAWSACVAARGVFGDRLQVGPALSTWSNAEHARHQQLLAAKTGLDHAPARIREVVESWRG